MIFDSVTSWCLIPGVAKTLLTTCVQRMQCKCVLTKMCTTRHDATHTDSVFLLCACVFKEQSCTYLAEILPHMPTANSVQAPHNSTNFGILMLGLLHGNQHFSPVPG